MPIIKSAKKRAKQALVRRDRNREFKAELRDRVKAVKEAVANGKKADVTKALSAAYSQLDKAVKKNLLPSNTVARKKSQLNELAKTVGVTPGTKKKAAPKKAATKKASAKKAVSKKPATKKATSKKPAAKKSTKSSSAKK